MIKYNFRYKGALEEDKFALSILNLSNSIKDSLDELEKKVKYMEDLKEKIQSWDNEDHYHYKTYIQTYRSDIK